MKIIHSSIFGILFILVLQIKLVAQPYESVFGKDTTQWNIVYIIPDYFPTEIFKAFGDTLINKEKYVPVYMEYSNKPLVPYGYLKEDTVAGRLWCRYPDGNEELLMDLSLAKSDTFYFGRNKPRQYTVDSVYYNLGKKYISFNEANYAYPILFIEGLGPFNMFYKEHRDFPEYAQVRCKHKDGVLVFMNPDGNGTCIDTFTVVHNYSEESIAIYPNPTSRYLNVSNNSTEIGTLELFNNLGYRVLSECILGNGQIDIGCLPNGFYVVKFKVRNKQSFTKLIKQ